MNKNYQDLLWEIKKMLADKVADKLDVNRQHIDIIWISTDLIGEYYCFDEDEDWEDGVDEYYERIFYAFQYKYRKDLKTLDYEDPVTMVWESGKEGDTEETADAYDVVHTLEEFDKIAEELWGADSEGAESEGE